MKVFTRSEGGYRAVSLGPIWITKLHLRRWLLMALQRMDPSYQDEWTLQWATRRGWIESRETGKWFLKGDPPPS